MGYFLEKFTTVSSLGDRALLSDEVMEQGQGGIYAQFFVILKSGPWLGLEKS